MQIWRSARIDPSHAASNALPFTVLTANQRFLYEVYHDLLRRQIDPSGLNSWETMIDAGASRISVVLDIESEPGYKFVRVEVEDASLQYLQLWVPKTSSADRIDAKGPVSDALRSEGERVQAANSVSYRWK